MANICTKTSRLYASSFTGSSAAYINYSISDQADRVVITSKMVVGASRESGSAQVKILVTSSSNWTVYTSTYNVSVNTYTDYLSGNTTAVTHDVASAQTTTIYKTHTTQNVNITAYYAIDITASGSLGEARGPITGSVTEALPTISAKTSYTVSYNANGGSGAPAAQTKWYGETLKLQTGTPTRTGWTFKGWATSSTATSATYAAGANYTANSGATLYAVWQRNTYTVSYNANGGTGAPANQTKQYGIDLVLSNTAPTFSGWTFKGWATSTANASAGTVNYPKGGTYQGNSAITLYAVWELTYKKPTLSNISVERCLQSGDLDDDGDCALVTADWTVFRSSLPQYYGGNTYPYANNAISQDSYVVTAGTYTETRTPTGASDTEYSVVVGSSFDSDTAYAVTISITDTQTIVSDHTTTAAGTLPTQYFPMDYNADATAVGFFMPAPKSGDGDGAYFGKDIHVFIDTATASGTDAAINQALTKLGWTDVLE